MANLGKESLRPELGRVPEPREEGIAPIGPETPASPEEQQLKEVREHIAAIPSPVIAPPEISPSTEVPKDKLAAEIAPADALSQVYKKPDIEALLEFHKLIGRAMTYSPEQKEGENE